MKKFLKGFLCFVLTLTIVMSSAIFVFAAEAKSTSDDGPIAVTISSAQSSYGGSATAEIKVNLTNNCNGTVKNVKAVALFDGVQPTNRESVMSIERTDFSAGQSKEIKFFIRQKDSKLGFFGRLKFLILEMFKGKATAPVVQTNDGDNYFDVVLPLTFGGNQAKQGVRVWYDSGIKLKINDHSSEVNNSDFVLSGTIETEAALENVTYSLITETDEGNSPLKTGETIIDGNNWSINLRLCPGVNKIRIKATDVRGMREEKLVTINYNNGSLYTLTSENEISIDGNSIENGTIFVNDIILIVFKNGTSESRKQSIISSVNGTVVGQLNGINQYQVRLPQAKTLAELETIINNIEQYPEVLLANYDTVILNAQESYVPSDPWNGTVNKNHSDFENWDEEDWESFVGRYWWEEKNSSSDWTDDDIDGNNWWLEAINAVKAWNYKDAYKDKFSKIKIGIVDDEFDVNHEDVSIKVLNPPKEDDTEYTGGHGTHVAGIIGANADNNKGITGVVKRANILAYIWTDHIMRDLLFTFLNRYDLEGYSPVLSNSILGGLVNNVEAGAKVVNLSLGFAKEGCNQTAGHINDYGKQASTYMGQLLEKGYDFIAVQAAGNESVNAINNGLFASVTSENCYSSSKVSKADIMDRIIIVAAARCEEDGTYKCCTFSNGGSQVDIAAPGYRILSTLPKTSNWNNNTVKGYGYLSGTSMAAPVVTGVAALVWSVNPLFTGKEVKNIVCTTSQTIAYDNPKSELTSGNFPMVDAYAAVARAIDETYAEGTVKVKFVNAENGEIINNVRITDASFIGSITFPSTGKNYMDVTNGELTLTLPKGTYMVRLSAEGYVDKYITLEIKANKTVNIGDIPLSKALGEGTVRIVLRWGENPWDLDSHFVGTTNSGSYSHVYFSNKYTKQDSAWLDIDDTSSYGPETVTITLSDFNNGFTYYVHNYSDRWSDSSSEDALNLAKSGAIVEVYRGESLIQSFSVPTNRKGTLWKVFSMDKNGNITYINEFGYEEDASNVGR